MNRVRSFYALGILVAALAVLVVATNRDSQQPQAFVGKLPGDLVIGNPVVYRNLTVFPVSSKTPRTQDRFITLDEGLASGKVEIVEKGAAPQSQPSAQPTDQELAADSSAAGGSPAVANEDPFAEIQQQAGRGNDVNELLVVNRSDRPLYLMPGEIIVGGDQDRTIGRELIVAADAKPVPLDVYCVEHGRWGGRAEAEYTNLSLVIDQSQAASYPVGDLVVPLSDARAVAALANSGKFVGSVGSLSKSARLAVVNSGGQQKVWDEVSSENAKAGVQPESGAFTANYAEEDAVKRLQPYIDKLQGPVAETENVVGVIVAVNGKVESMDVFEATPLFKKLWPKLLKSHALDAANAAGEQVTRICTRQDAAAFLQETAAAGTSTTETKGDVAVSRRESERVLLFSAHSWREVREPAAAATDVSAGGFGGGGLGGVHAAAFAK